MKDGKYLVLLHPSQTGETRRREYVGKDPQKIQEPRDAIRRAKDYDALAKQYERLELIVTYGYALAAYQTAKPFVLLCLALPYSAHFGAVFPMRAAGAAR